MASFIYFTPGEVLTLADLDLTFQVCGDNINVIENRQIQPLSLEWFHYAPPIGFSTDPDISWTSSGTVGGSWGDLSAYTIHSPSLAVEAWFVSINDDTIIAPATPGNGWVLAGPTLSGSDVSLNPITPGNRFFSVFYSASANFKTVDSANVGLAYIAIQVRNESGVWETFPASVRAAVIEEPGQFAYSETSVHLSVEGIISAFDMPGAARIISGVRVVVTSLGIVPGDVLELESSSLVVLFLEGA